RNLTLKPDTGRRPAIETRLAELGDCSAQPSPAAPEPAAASPATSPPDVAPRPDGARPGAWRRVSGIAAAATGVVLIGASVYFGLDARDAAGQTEDFQADGGEWTAEREAVEARGHRSERRAIVLGVVGGTALAAGAALWLWDRHEESTSRPVIAVGPDGGLGGWAWRF